MRDLENFEYLHDLEARLRKLTHNEDERGLFIASAPDRVDSWALPMDGGIERQALERIIQEMVKRGRLERPVPVEKVFRDEAVRDAYREVSSRASSSLPLIRPWQPLRNMVFKSGEKAINRKQAQKNTR